MAGKFGLFVGMGRDQDEILPLLDNPHLYSGADHDFWKSLELKFSHVSGGQDSDMDLESNGTDLNNSNFKSELYLAQVLSQRSLSQVCIPKLFIPTA